MRRYLVGQAARGHAQWTLVTVLPLVVLARGGSAFHVGLVWGLQTGPVLVLAALGGVIADRFGKARSLVPLHLGLGSVQLLVALLLGREASLGLVIATAGAYGVITGVEMPVRQSLVSELVPARALRRAVALHQTAFNLTRVVSPALAVAVMAALGPQMPFLLGAAASALAAVALGATSRFCAAGRTPARDRPCRAERCPGRAAFQSALVAFRGGVAASVRNKRVRAILVLIAIVSVAGTGFQSVLSVHLARSLEMDPSRYGFVLSAVGLGTLAGSGAVAAIGSRRRPPVRLIAVMLLLVVAAIPVARGFAAILPLVFAAGLAYGLLMATTNAGVQSAVQRRLIGRVVGHYLAAINGGMAASALLYGAVADAAGTDLAFIVVAGAGLACLGVAWLPWRRLRGDPHPHD